MFGIIKVKRLIKANEPNPNSKKIYPSLEKKIKEYCKKNGNIYYLSYKDDIMPLTLYIKDYLNLEAMSDKIIGKILKVTANNVYILIQTKYKYLIHKSHRCSFIYNVNKDDVDCVHAIYILKENLLTKKREERKDEGKRYISLSKYNKDTNLPSILDEEDLYTIDISSNFIKEE